MSAKTWQADRLLKHSPLHSTDSAGPIATITIATNSLAASRRFYEEGLGLSLSEAGLDKSRSNKSWHSNSGPIDSDTRHTLTQLWQLPAGTEWSCQVFSRPGTADAAKLRLLVLDPPGSHYRTDWEPAVLGPYTIGFPNTDQPAFDARLRALSFGARNPVEITTFTHPDGRSWEIIESIHTAPDFIAAVGIARGAGNLPISPVDASGRGGPAYSMMVVADLQRMSDFLQQVLGYEQRIRRVQTSRGTQGAMRTPDGTQFELVQLFPPRGEHGFIILIQFLNLAVRQPSLPPRLPSSGLVMYSFPVLKLEPLLARAAAAGATAIVGPVLVDNAPHGLTRHATLLAPNGVMLEFFEAPNSAAT